MTVKLKPCPFCGSEAKLITSAPLKLFSDEGETIHFKVRCDAEDTGCIGAFVNLWEITKERAIKKWNRRTDNDR